MDLQWLNISEGSGTPTTMINVTFENVESFRRILSCQLYDGGATHYMTIDVINDDTGEEIMLREIPTNNVMSCSYFGIDDDDALINAGGNVTIQYRHPLSGNPSHDFHLGCVKLER